MHRTGPEPTEQEVLKKIQEAEIPPTAASVTMALLVRASEEAERSGNDRQALDCLRMVYDLSGDAGIGARIQEIENRKSNS